MDTLFKIRQRRCFSSLFSMVWLNYGPRILRTIGPLEDWEGSCVSSDESRKASKNGSSLVPSWAIFLTRYHDMRHLRQPFLGTEASLRWKNKTKQNESNRNPCGSRVNEGLGTLTLSEGQGEGAAWFFAFWICKRSSQAHFIVLILLLVFVGGRFLFGVFDFFAHVVVVVGRFQALPVELAFLGGTKSIGSGRYSFWVWRPCYVVHELMHS